MRIKKTSETRPLSARVLNVNSGSQTDTYSCDYLNADAITIRLSTSQEITGTTDTKISFDTVVNQAGTNLTLDTTNNQVKIGKGISYVVVSVQLTFNSITNSAIRRVSIYKNSSTVARGMGVLGANFSSINCVSFLIPVEENDTISFYSRNDSASTIYASQYDTYATITAI